jgi:hypothetical protein
LEACAAEAGVCAQAPAENAASVSAVRNSFVLAFMTSMLSFLGLVEQRLPGELQNFCDRRGYIH